MTWRKPRGGGCILRLATDGERSCRRRHQARGNSRSSTMENAIKDLIGSAGVGGLGSNIP